MADSANPTATDPAVTVVVPARNEAANIAALVEEIAKAMTGRWSFEVVYVNDGSTDDSEAVLSGLKAGRPWLRQLKHEHSCGKSAALKTGVAAARAPIIATLNGDGQNDPSFIPALVRALEVGVPQVGLVASQRVGRRTADITRIRSRIANRVRRAILRDGTRDTGCGLNAFRRDAFLTLPYFDGVHRYLPALFIRDGYAVVYVDVVDRPSRPRRSRDGDWDPAGISIRDLLGVRWLIWRRKRIPMTSEIA